MRQVEKAGEDVLNDGLRAVGTNVGDGDAVITRGDDVDIVGARRGKTDEAYVGAGLEDAAR